MASRSWSISRGLRGSWLSLARKRRGERKHKQQEQSEGSAAADPAHSFLLLLCGEHFIEQCGADVFQTVDCLVDGRLILESQVALDVTQPLGHLPGIDFHVFHALPALDCGIARLLGVGDDVPDRIAGLLDMAFVVKFVGVAKLLLRDFDAEPGTLFGRRLFELFL